MELIKERKLWNGNYKDLKNMITNFNKRKSNEWVNIMAKIQLDFLKEIGLDDSYVIPILINNRLTITTGRFHPYDEHIEISGRLVALTGLFCEDDFSVLADTIKHETIHSILYKQGLNNDDGGDIFENMCKKYHVSSSYESGYKINKTETPVLSIVQHYKGNTNKINYSVADQLTPNENKYVDVKYTYTEVIYQLLKV